MIIGSPAPAFALACDDGTTVRLADLKGKQVVLYFYPKDATSGCTVEACEFRDSWEALTRRGAIVLGVSPDSVASHRKFRDAQALPFPLLSDPDHAVAERYGVWGEKTLYGRRFFGIRRTTFIIDAQGRIASVFRNVKPRGHAAQVLEAL